MRENLSTQAGRLRADQAGHLGKLSISGYGPERPETAGYLMGEVTARAAPHSGYLNRQDLADQAMASRRISPLGTVSGI